PVYYPCRERLIQVQHTRIAGTVAGRIRKNHRYSVPVSKNYINLWDVPYQLWQKLTPDAKCLFSYSTAGATFSILGKPFQMREWEWIGTKVGLFCSRLVSNHDGGRVSRTGSK
ncbi:MAG: hypothetical protein PHE44_04220, partial [Proteiniphilum sp.]|nr:hypothetical protein [Proteiniphilum sp.]MDD3075736.1 hypothetical protein [Proteiniphilum sp.]